VIAAATPNPPLDIDEWLERRNGVVLPARGNAFPGPVDLERTPYLRLPLKLFTTRRVERLGCCFARQCGKTMWLFVIFGYCVDYDPGPTLLFYPTADMGRAISKDRFIPMIHNTPTLRRHLTGRPDDLQFGSYTFDRMTARFGHAGSEVGGRSHPIRYLIKDETSAMTAGASSNADDTTTSFWNRRIVEASTPMHEQDNMWRFLGLKPIEGKKGDELWDIDSYEPTSATTVLFYNAPCPRCQKKIVFLWRQIRWPDDCAIRDIPNNGWYECQECGGRIEDSDKPAMLKEKNGAEWLPHEKQRDEPWGKWIGCHLSKMYGPWDSCSFGSIGHAGLRARLSKDPEVIGRFVNNFLALPYSLQNEAIDLVDEAAITQNVLGYHRNTVPEACRALTIGIDIGKETVSRVHWMVQGFGTKGHSWRIAWGILDDLYQMEAYIRDAVFQHPKAGRMLILCGAADSRYNKPEVIRFCKLFRNRIFPIQGERRIKVAPGNSASLPHKPYYPERDDKGKALPDSMVGYRINTVYWKQWLYGRINCLHKQPPAFFFPIERDEALERHLRSEEEILTRKKGSAEFERAWVIKHGYAQNHYLDSTLYGVAIADIFGIMHHAEDGPILTGIKQTQKAPPPTSGGASPANPMGFGTMNH